MKNNEVESIEEIKKDKETVVEDNNTQLNMEEIKEEEFLEIESPKEDIEKKEEEVIEYIYEESNVGEANEEITLEQECPEEKNEIDEDKKDKKKNKEFIKIGVVALVSSIVGSGATMCITGSMGGNNTSAPIIVSNADIKGVGDLNIYQAIAKKASPSVVGIMTTSFSTNNIFSVPIENSGIGTGVIVNSNGYILTNAHVVGAKGENEIKVVLNDGKNVDGKVMWSDSALDLAVVKINGNGYIAAELGDSDKVAVGDISVAIGNPLGIEFQSTVTQGIISGMNRSVEGSTFSMEGLLQTDASINPGNSGGPLLNTKGQVIGINTAKATTGEGMGFAIPINVAKPIVEQVIKTGTFDKVTLGIKGMSLSAFESLVGADLDAEEGVYIVEVQDGTPAKNAGIKTGDVIVEINDVAISDMNGLTKELYKFKLGEESTVVVNRSGEKITLKVKFKKVEQ